MDSKKHRLRLALTLFNATCWIGLFWALRYWDQSPELLVHVVSAIMFVLSLPLAWFAMVFFLPPTTESDVLMAAMTIGVNLFIWAHLVTEIWQTYLSKKTANKQPG